MSIKTRDIEELFKRHGAERGAMKAIMLLTEVVVSQQEALLDIGKTMDAMGGAVSMVVDTQVLTQSQLSNTRKTLGLDIDEEGISSEPIQDIGKLQ